MTPKKSDPQATVKTGRKPLGAGKRKKMSVALSPEVIACVDEYARLVNTTRSTAINDLLGNALKPKSGERL
jgi:hypothetical protein